MDDVRAILTQIGWYRDDTHFLSLNLTTEQLRAINDAVVHDDPTNESIEETIAKACREYVRAKRDTVAGVLADQTPTKG